MTNSGEFEEFMRNHQNMVYSTALRLLGNETDAADISQEVFLKAFERYEELSANVRRSGWLRAVTTNLCLNHLSRYRSRWRFFTDMFSGDDAEEFAETLPAPPSEGVPSDEEYGHQVLEAALQKLPASQRVPLVLYHFEQMSYEDIARQLGVSLGKVKTDIHRGREALRLKLKLTPEGDIVSAFQPSQAVPSRTIPPGARLMMGCVL